MPTRGTRSRFPKRIGVIGLIALAHPFGSRITLISINGGNRLWRRNVSPENPRFVHHRRRPSMRSTKAFLIAPLFVALSSGAAILPAPAQTVTRETVTRDVVTPSGTTRTTTVTVAPTAPPPPEVETIPAAPSQLVYWQPGHWGWSGSTWVWAAGHYVQRPEAQSVWIPGHWLQEANGWTWVDGYWRS
jgi:hypothetical protein